MWDDDTKLPAGKVSSGGGGTTNAVHIGTWTGLPTAAVTRGGTLDSGTFTLESGVDSRFSRSAGGSGEGDSLVYSIRGTLNTDLVGVLFVAKVGGASSAIVGYARYTFGEAEGIGSGSTGAPPYKGRVVLPLPNGRYLFVRTYVNADSRNYALTLLGGSSHLDANTRIEAYEYLASTGGGSGGGGLSQSDVDDRINSLRPVPYSTSEKDKLVSIETGAQVTKIPRGGTDGQILTKTAAGDYLMAWEDAPAGGTSTGGTGTGVGVSARLVGTWTGFPTTGISSGSPMRQTTFTLAAGVPTNYSRVLGSRTVTDQVRFNLGANAISNNVGPWVNLVGFLFVVKVGDADSVVRGFGRLMLGNLHGIPATSTNYSDYVSISIPGLASSYLIMQGVMDRNNIGRYTFTPYGGSNSLGANVRVEMYEFRQLSGAGLTQDQEAKIAAIPDGGTAGQVLTKDSATDYDAGWKTPTLVTVPRSSVVELADGPGDGITISSVHQAVYSGGSLMTGLTGDNAAKYGATFDLDNVTHGEIHLEATFTLATRSANTIKFESGSSAEAVAPTKRAFDLVFASAIKALGNFNVGAADKEWVEAVSVPVYNGTTLLGNAEIHWWHNSSNNLGYTVSWNPEVSQASVTFALTTNIEASFTPTDPGIVTPINLVTRGRLVGRTGSIRTGHTFAYGDVLGGVGATQAFSWLPQAFPTGYSGDGPRSTGGENPVRLFPPGRPPATNVSGLTIVSKVGSTGATERYSVTFLWGATPLSEEGSTFSSDYGVGVLFFDGAPTGQGAAQKSVNVRYTVFSHGGQAIEFYGNGTDLPAQASIDVYEFGVFAS